MKLKYVLFSTLILFSIVGVAQQTVKDEGKNIEVALGFLCTNKMEITRDYQALNNDINSNVSPAFQISVAYQKSIRKNYFYNVGLLGGIHSMNLNLKLTDEFNYLGWGGFNSKHTVFDFPYVGVLTGINRSRYLSNKNKISFGVSLNWLFFINQEYEFGVSAIPNSGQVKKLFSTIFDVNRNNKLYIIPEFQFLWQRKVFKSFLVNISIKGGYNERNIFKANYKLFGDSEERSGILTKNIKYLGIQIGCAYNLK